MRFPWQPKPRNAPLEDLHAQLVNARASHASAQAATETAQIAFDDLGEASAEKSLLAAQSAEQSAAAHLGRAERLVSAAEAAQKAEQRAELEREALAIEEELSAKNAEDEQLVRAELAGYLAAAKARAARHDRNVALVRKSHRLQAIREALGLESRGLLAHELDAEPPHHVVAKRLFEQAATFASHVPIARYLDALGRVEFRA